MLRIVLIALVGCVTLGGWALAQQQELRDHLGETHARVMDDASCPTSSNSTGGG